MASESESLKPNAVKNKKKGLKWKDIRKYRHQILATTIATIGSFGTGTVFGWSALATSDILHRKEFPGITKENEISWVTSLAIFGAFFAGPAAGYAMDKIGRKKAIIIFSFPFFIGWAIMWAAHLTSPKGFYLLYIGRLITGFCAGAFLVVIPAYIKEIACDTLRGILGSVVPLTIVSGILYTFLIGTYSHWAVLTACCGIIPILLCFTAFIIPETPRFLLTNNKLNEAIESYRWLNGISKHDHDEETKSSVLASLSGDCIVSAAPNTKKYNWAKIATGPVAKPIIIMVLVMIFQQCGGVNAVTLYTVQIFEDAGNFVEPRTATIILGIFQVVFVLASMALIDVLGRKTLLVSCSLIMGLCLIGLGIYFYLKEKANGSEKDILWLPVATTWIYVAAYSVGTGSVPWVLANELYHPDYRAISATIISSVYWLFGFLVAQTYGYLTLAFNASGAFWTYGGFCIGGAIFAALCVPETKGKSHEEILKYFGGEVSRISIRIDDSNAGDGDTINYSLTPTAENRLLNSQSDTETNESEVSNKKVDHV